MKYRSKLLKKIGYILLTIITILGIIYTVPAVSLNNKGNANIGQFIYSYQPGIDENDQYINSVVQQSQIFESNISILQQMGFNLRQDLEIRWMSCRNYSNPSIQKAPSNAFYSPNEKKITLCYELFNDIALKYIELVGQSPEDALKSTLDAYLFIMYHELGHGLIDFFQIPITGKEEDAVDDFAAYMLLARSESEEDKIINIILSAARVFYLSAQSNQVSPEYEHLLYWGEHSLGEQRFANLLCIILGSNPDRYANILVANPDNPEDVQNPLKIPLSRARRCVNSEYPQKMNSWTRLIIPHLITQQGDWGETSDSGNSPNSPPPVNEVPGAWGDY